MKHPIAAAGRPDPAHSADVPLGYRVGGWEITEAIAVGGWGSVYAAQRILRSVDGGPEEAALKFWSTAGLAPLQVRQLAETAAREVEFGHGSAHPSLIRVLESLIVDDPDRPDLDGTVVLVMERADRSLLDLLAAADGREPVPDAGRILTEMCQGLAHLHASGWVHGDLKPGNILLMTDGSVRLADFGLSCQVDGTHGYAPPLGSPDYLPPERHTDLLGERGVAVRTSRDVWALGVTAHQLLTGGAFPFPGATPGARATAVQEYAEGRARLALDPELPEVWREFVTDCLTPDPTQRAAHTAETLLARAGDAVRQVRPRRRRWLWPVAGAAVVAAAVAGVPAALGWWDTGSGGGSPTAVQAPATPVASHVFNIDGNCSERTVRVPTCSMGLARNPKLKYGVGNIVAHRVWHNDALFTDCVVEDGDRVEDETGVGTPRWFRVRLDDTPGGYAWLPAVRTNDRPEVPVCSSSASS